MKIETLVFDNLKKIIPKDASRILLFANVTDTSYELFFYCIFSDGKVQQCYTLAEEGILDSYLLDMSFSKIVAQIKADKKYKTDYNNVFTFMIDNSGVRLDVEYYDKNVKIYKIKKNWKEKYLL